MEVAKYIGLVIYIIVCIAIVVLAMMQSKQSNGASGAVMGGPSSSNFYEKNKGRTKEGKMKKWTIIFGILFVILAVALGVLWQLTA